VLVLLAILIGVLFATAIYAMLRRDFIDLVFGLVLLSHAANLLVFSSSGLVRGSPPLPGEDPATVADPLPQALVLTAIVISFGLTAFLMVLVVQLRQALDTEDENEIERQA